MRFPWKKADRPRGARNEEEDNDVEAVIFRNLWKHHHLLPPKSKYKSYWDVLMFIFVIYNSIFVPVDILLFSIEKTLAQCIVDFLIDILFVVDMIANLRTTFYNEEGELVLEPRRIYKRYLCSFFFVIDFLAVFPFDIIASGGWDCGVVSSTSEGDNSTGIVKLLKALRLLRLVRFRKELDRLSGANALRVVVSLSGFLLMAHWIACIWWAVGFLEYSVDEENAAAANASVVCDSTRACSWLRRIPNGQTLSPDSPFEQQYVSSFFWALTTLMKTPWIGPDKISEKLVATFAIFSGAIFYASFLGTVNGSYASYSKAAAQKRDKINNLTEFINHMGVPTHLREKMIKHTNTRAAMLPLGLVNSQVLMQLPCHLRGEVAMEIYASSCASPAMMFPAVSIECAKSLITRLQFQLVMPGQVLIAKGEVCTQLYFLVRGALRATLVPPVENIDGSDSTNTSNSTGPGGDDRRNSEVRGKTYGGMREFETPGFIVGLVEPMNATANGIYPFYVYATKKTLMLSIKQNDIKNVLVPNFKEDIVPFRTYLIKEHTSLAASLKIEQGDDSPVTMCEFAAARASQKLLESQTISFNDEDKARVTALEVTINSSLKCVAQMQQDMAVLPRILKLVMTAAGNDNLVSITSNRGGS